MSNLIFGYWRLRGLGEQIRLLLQYLGLEYKEIFYERGEPPECNKEDWMKVKYTLGLDYPNIPYLIDGDFKMTESNAILRYLCEKYKPELLGESIRERAYVNMSVGVLLDIQNIRIRFVYEGKNFKGSEELYSRMHNKLSEINTFLGKNKFLAGEKLTYPDLMFHELFEAINDVLEPIIDKYPNIKRHYNDINEIPSIKKYKEAREPLPYNYTNAIYGSTTEKTKF